MLRLRTLIPLALTAIALSFDSAWSRGGSDVIDQALERAFPGCAIERVVCRLGDPERAKVNEELLRVAGLAGENLKKVSNCHVQ